MNGSEKRNILKIAACLLLLSLLGLAAGGGCRRIPGFDRDIVTVGVFSDSYWEVQNGYSYKILDDAIKLFREQNPGVEVRYVSGLMKDDYSEWLSEQMLNGTAPDVFFVIGEHFHMFAEAGALKDLTAMIAEDRDFDPRAFYTPAYESGAYLGVQYALPYECAPKLMFVNRSILDAEGIAIPDQAWTWDEFYEICQRVTRDTDGDGVLDQFGTVGYTWEDAVDSNGAGLFNEQGTECCLTSDHVGEAIVFIEKLEELNDRYSVSRRDFALGNVVFQPMLFSEYRAYKSYPLSIKKYSGFDWECLTMPAGPEGDNISRLDTLSIAMNADTAHPGYAWELMKILTCDPQIQAEIFDYSEGVSVLREVVESEQTLKALMDDSDAKTPMNLKLLSDVVENAAVVPRFHNYDGAVAEADRAIRAILDSNSNINMERIIQNRAVNNYLKER